MGKRKINIKRYFEIIGDKVKLALIGVFELLRRPKYLIVFIVSLFLFLFILSFFKDGNSNWLLLCSSLDFSRKITVIGQVLVGILMNFTSFYGVIIVFMAILQALIIPLLIYTWRQRVQDSKNKDNTIDGASTGSIGAILGFVALGCPSCGVGLLMPILSAIAGAGALAVAETMSQLFTIVAFLLLSYTVIKLGNITFVNLCNEKAKRKEENAKSN